MMTLMQNARLSLLVRLGLCVVLTLAVFNPQWFITAENYRLYPLVFVCQLWCIGMCVAWFGLGIIRFGKN